MEQFSVLKIMDRIPDEASAYAFLEDVRWGDTGPVCPHCANVGAYFLTPKTGEGKARATRTGSMSQRRVWKCKSCRKQFSVLTGTIFHGSKIPVRTWVLVVFEMCASKNGVSAREIERKYDLTAKSAWFMLHRIREAMKREPLAGMLRGTVVADETFIGGKPKNKHRQGKPRPYGPGGGGRVQRGNPHENKTAVLALVDKTTGEVRSRVIADVTGPTLRKAIAEQVDMAETVLHTDGWAGYRTLANDLVGHEFVDHAAYEYVRGDVTTNHAEGYFSQLKRSIDGTHHHVSVEHLPRYLAEHDFRYSTRKVTDTARMRALVDRTAGRRLSYRPLTDGGPPPLA